MGSGMIASASAPTTLNYALFQAVNGLAGQHLVLDLLMIRTAKFSPITLELVLAGLWLTWRGRRSAAHIIAAISGFLALGIGQIIEFECPRDRPYLAHHDTSFPSDHATLAFAIAVLVWQFNSGLGSVSFH